METPNRYLLNERMRAFVNELIPVIYNLIEFHHIDGSLELDFLNHTCSSSSLGTMSSEHFLSVQNPHETIDEGGYQDKHITSH